MPTRSQVDSATVWGGHSCPPLLGLFLSLGLLVIGYKDSKFFKSKSKGADMSVRPTPTYESQFSLNSCCQNGHRLAPRQHARQTSSSGPSASRSQLQAPSPESHNSRISHLRAVPLVPHTANRSGPRRT